MAHSNTPRTPIDPAEALKRRSMAALAAEVDKLNRTINRADATLYRAKCVREMVISEMETRIADMRYSNSQRS